MIEQDYLLRQIKEMIAAIMKALFDASHIAALFLTE